jgi:hypothetical protein
VPLPSFESARLKLERATEHAIAVEKMIDVWLDSDAYTIGSEIDPKTGDKVRRAQIREQPPVKISLLVGDTVQNLRAALDHSIYALAERQLGTIPLEIEESLMFLIVGHQNSKGKSADGAAVFAAQWKRRLSCLSDDARRAIEYEQPYFHDRPRDGYRFHPLWVLHEMSRIDKHRRVTVATAWLGLSYVGIGGDSANARVKFGRAEGPVEDGDVLVTHAPREDIQGHFTRGVAFHEPGLAMTVDSIQDQLKMIRDKVDRIVGVLERIP